MPMIESTLGFDTEEEVVEYMQSQNGTSQVGIIFTQDQTANLLKITLRFFNDLPWKTDELWPDTRSGIRDYKHNDGGFDPGYVPRGFVYLQNSIFKALNGEPTVRISLNRMPVQGFAADDFQAVLTTLGALLLIFAFLPSFTTTAKVTIYFLPTMIEYENRSFEIVF